MKTILCVLMACALSCATFWVGYRHGIAWERDEANGLLPKLVGPRNWAIYNYETNTYEPLPVVIGPCLDSASSDCPWRYFPDAAMRDRAMGRNP